MRLGALLLLAVLPAACAQAGTALQPETVLPWREPHPAFGGFSAIEVIDGGTAFVAVTDRGWWATGAMEREEGRLVAVRLTGIGPLLSIAGEPLAGEDADAEGLARDSQGRFFVSFEHFHRIRRYDRIDGPAAAVEGHPDFPRLQRNSGLEALAIDADDVIYAVPERSGAWERPFPVYRKRDGRWDTDLSLPREGRFLVTGADWGPDGRFYLLERDAAWFGFRTRIRRFVLGTGGFDDGETLLETDWRELDNMEGISVWEDAEGIVRITLISDDNFLWPIQRTILAEYRVSE
jgi:hypothetical protein